MKKYILKLKLTGILFVIGLIQLNAQSNMQIIFFAAQTALAGADTVYLYSGVSPNNPGNFNQYTTGELAQPGSGIGRMTKIGQDQWGICLEPFSYFSQGLSGAIPAGTTLYGIGDILFHGPGGSNIVQLNNSNTNFRINMVATSTNVITQPTSNSPGQLTGEYKNCTLGINEIQIQNGSITNNPNPMDGYTQFYYTLKSSGKVSLKIFNTIGQIVKTMVNDKFQSPGSYAYKWIGDNDSGRKLFNGVYYYTLSVNNKAVQANKLVISR